MIKTFPEANDCIRLNIQNCARFPLLVATGFSGIKIMFSRCVKRRYLEQIAILADREVTLVRCNECLNEQSLQL